MCSCCCDGTCAGRPWTAAEREASWFTRLSSYVDPLCVEDVCVCVCGREDVCVGGGRMCVWGREGEDVCVNVK